MRKSNVLPLIAVFVGFVILVFGIAAVISDSNKNKVGTDIKPAEEITGGAEAELSGGSSLSVKKEPDHKDKNEPEKPDELSLFIQNIEALRQKGDYLQAVNLLLSTELTFPEKSALTDTVTEEYRSDILEKLKLLVCSYDYAKGEALLSEAMDIFPEDEYLKKRLDMCSAYKNTVKFEGTIEHIFFHPLVAYPEKAFDGDAQAQGMDNYMATVPEFKAVMQQSYDLGYILIDPHLLYSVNPDGTVTKLDVMIPAGKKPLILSTDDYNFLTYMRENGTVSGLALDENGTVVTFTDDENGVRTYSDDNEVVPILDKFVEEHPDFAYGGIKGAIGLTGYQGTLGYATDDPSVPGYEENVKAAADVASAMKANGWLFASHSYGHYHYEKKTLDYVKTDTDKWLKEVGAIVGETDLHYYPYGEIIPQDDAKLQYMIDKGFRFFFGVSQIPYLRYYSTNILQTRRNVDGIALRGKHLCEIYDTAAILDPARGH